MRLDPSLIPRISPRTILRTILGFLVQVAQNAGLAPSTRMLPAIPVPREFEVAPQEFPLLWSQSAFPAHPGWSPKPCFSLWGWENPIFPHGWGRLTWSCSTPGMQRRGRCCSHSPCGICRFPRREKKIKDNIKKSVKFQISNKK